MSNPDRGILIPEAVYRRYAIVSESDMQEGAAKLTVLHGDAPDSRHIDAHERVFGTVTSRHISKKPRHEAASQWLGTELNRRHEDFQSANLVREIGRHVHQTTSNGVVKRLHDIELCH